MKQVFAMVALVVALFVFGIQYYVADTVEGAVVDATANVVNEAPIDAAQKESILSTFTILEIAGVVGGILAVIAIVHKYT